MAKPNRITIYRVMPELREYAKAKGTTVDEIANQILEDAILHFIKGKISALKGMTQ